MSIEHPTKDTPWLKSEWDKMNDFERANVVQKQVNSLEEAAMLYDTANKKYNQYIRFTLISLLTPIIIALIFDSAVLFVIGLIMVLVPSLKQINEAKQERDIYRDKFDHINHSQPWEYYHDYYNWP